MADLIAIVKATRRSALAIARMQRWNHQLGDSRSLQESRDCERKYQRARRDFAAAQAVLAANPLPGDR